MDEVHTKVKVGMILGITDENPHTFYVLDPLKYSDFFTSKRQTVQSCLK